MIREGLECRIARLARSIELLTLVRDALGYMNSFRCLTVGYNASDTQFFDRVPFWAERKRVRWYRLRLLTIVGPANFSVGLTCFLASNECLFNCRIESVEGVVEISNSDVVL
jgi:hypothetical protein